jgi:putative tricarboxylic transport membrane protein
MAMLAKAAGIDARSLKILVFRGGSESVTNLLGGHIDAMVQAVNNAIPSYKAGRMRILCLSTQRRAPGLADVPTCREAGYDAVMDGWTIFAGPKGLTPAQVAFWENVFKKSVENKVWKDYLAANSWDPGYMNAQETRAYLDKQHAQDKALLTELGMAKE